MTDRPLQPSFLSNITNLSVSDSTSSASIPLRPASSSVASVNRTLTAANSSEKSRSRITLHPVVSGRGRKKMTPSSAVVAPRLLASAASSSLSEKNSTVGSSASSSSRVAAPVAATSASAPQIYRPPPKVSTTAADKASTEAEVTSIAVKKKSKKKRLTDWPTSSADYLPPLADGFVQKMQDKHHVLEFPINEECTALTLSPTGRLLIACFSDGTLRLFDLTSTFHTHIKLGKYDAANNKKSSLEDGLFDVDSSSSEDDSDGTSTSSLGKHQLQSSFAAASYKSKTGGKRNRYVLSKENQRFGTVAAQIHAKGVHTSLLMDVDVAQDGEYCFAGVLRGSMELVAVHLGAAEAYLDRYAAAKLIGDDGALPEPSDLLDLTTVFRRSDAKLRGFGACTRLRNGTPKIAPQYLLFTGKAIKNIHVWKFEPPLDPGRNSSDDDAKWICLYDTQTNGNTITQLQFRHDSHGLLQGISKSDDQKLRVWDLSYEQHRGNPKHPYHSKRSVIQKFATAQEKLPLKNRPKRPPFCDVTNSENTLGVCGGFSVCCGGSTQYNHMSIVPLDVANVQAPYNHTELALPLGGTEGAVARTHRRQQRGELKSVVSVAGMTMDPGYVLLEVSDGSLIQYCHGDNGQPKVEMTSLPGLQNLEILPLLQAERISRKICLAKIGSVGLVATAVATYDSVGQRGTITMKPLNPEVLSSPGCRQTGFWGFCRHLKVAKKQKKLAMAARSVAAASQTVLNCPSPRSKTDISNWTHPPTSTTSERTTRKPANLTQVPGASVKLFGSESQDAAPSSSPAPPTMINKADISTKAKGMPVTVSTTKKRKTVDTPPFLQTPLVTAGVTVVPQSSVQSKLASKSDKNKGVPFKGSPPKNTPGTPPIEPLGGSPDNGNVSTCTLNASGKVQQVSPDSKEFPPSPAAPETSQIGNDKNAITQYFDKHKPSTGSATQKKRASDAENEKKVAATKRAKAVKAGKKSPVTPRKRSHIGSPEYTQECLMQEQRLKIIKENFLPKTSVNDRMGLPSELQELTTSRRSDAAEQELARMKLAAEHRGSHEMLLQRIISSAQFAVKNFKTAKTLADVEDAEENFQEDFRGYYERLNELLWKQTEEAANLADLQAFFSSSPVPTLQVSYPFYGVFDDIIGAVSAITQKAR